MEKYYTQLIGTPIITNVGQTAGYICDLVISPENGKVMGFIASPNGKKVVSPIDVLELDKVLKIHDHESIFETQDLHHVSNILHKQIRIIKSKVVTQKGLYLGQVVDLAIHDKLLTLNKIFVAKIFMGIFYYDKKIINWTDIIEIKKDKIIVKDPVILIPIKKLSIDPAPSV